MLLTVILLISCILTARLLEKKKMRVASVMYSAVFIVLLVAVLLAVEVETIGFAISNIIGEDAYLQAHEVLLNAINSEGYGTCIYIALLFTLFLQITTFFVHTVYEIVWFDRSESAAYFPKKYVAKHSFKPRVLYLTRRINLLNCLMLN